MNFSFKKIFLWLGFFLFAAHFLQAADVDNLPTNGWKFVRSLQAISNAYINTKISQESATNSVEIIAEISVVSFDIRKRRLMGFDGKRNNYFGLNANNGFEVGTVFSGVTARPGCKYLLKFTQTRETSYLNVFQISDSEENILLNSAACKKAAFNKSFCTIFGVNKFSCPGVKVYSFKVSIDGKLRGDFRPVFNETEKVAAMYDSVTGGIFQNSGKGSLQAEDNDLYLPEDSGKKVFVPSENFAASNLRAEKVLTYTSKKAQNNKPWLACLQILFCWFIFVFLLCGLYFLARMSLNFLPTPLFIISVLLLLLWIGGLVHGIWLSFIAILFLSFLGWFELFKNNAGKIWRDFQWRDVAWIFFIFGALILGFSCANLTLEGNEVVCNFVPYLQQICQRGNCLDFWIQHELSTVGCLSWFLGKLSFCAFSQQLILWTQLILALAAFSTFFELFSVGKKSLALWITLCLVSLFLLNLTDKFFWVLGVIILFGGLIFIGSLSKSETKVYKLFAAFLAVLVFLFLFASPNVSKASFLRYYFPTGIFALWLFGVILSALFGRERPLTKTVPVLLLLVLFAPKGNLALALIISLFVLLALIINKYSGKVCFKYGTIVSVVWLIFSVAVIFSWLPKEERSLQNIKAFNSSLILNASCSQALSWHDEKLASAVNLKSAYKFLNNLAQLWQKEPYTTKSFTLNHWLVLALYSSIILLVLILFSLPRLSWKTKLKFSLAFLFWILGSGVLVYLSLYFSSQTSLFAAAKTGQWNYNSLIFFPSVALFSALILGFAVKAFNLISERKFFPALLVAAFLLPAISLYVWLPNKNELWFGIEKGDYNKKFQTIFLKSAVPKDFQKLLILSIDPLAKLDAAYLLMNFPGAVPRNVAFITLQDDFRHIQSAVSQSDGLLWLPSPPNNVKFPAIWEELLCVTNRGQFTKAEFFKKENKAGHLYFVAKNSKVPESSENLLMNPAFAENFSNWILPAASENVVSLRGGVVLINNRIAKEGYGISQDIPLSSGAVYRISCSASAENQVPVVTIENSMTFKALTSPLIIGPSEKEWEYSTGLLYPKVTGNYKVSLLCGLGTNGVCRFKNINCTLISQIKRE